MDSVYLQNSADLLPILVAPHKSLKTKAREVRDEDMDFVRELLPRMFHAMYKAPGIGLAAPQVDVGLRFFIVDLGKRRGNTDTDEPGEPFVLINPRIIAASSDLATREEGCLSLPNQYADVTRPAAVKLSYMTPAGKRAEIEGEELMAACLQHEFDHLEGTLFVDHLSALKRNMIMRRLAKEQRQK